jgi:ribonuclease J
VMVVLHTPDGCVVYSNDFKLDNSPTLGKKPDSERMKKLGEHGVKLLITDSLYAHDHRKMPSEFLAKEMLRDVLLNVDNENKAIIVTTFSSHIARLKSTIELAKQLDRRVVILGRSLAKYCIAAEKSGIYYFSREAEIVKYSKKVAGMLARIEKDGKEKYLIITTGHQGEPKAILSKIARGELKFRLSHEDHIIFSCNVIPTPINVQCREILERALLKFGVRMFKGIHVSGHGAREDMRDLIKMLVPEHLIPAHSEEEVMNHFADLAKELGYSEGKSLHLIKSGESLKISDRHH